MSGGVLVFDMDGVLVDVSESYRETIRRTVEHYTGQQVSRELIQDYKNRGGWNNDWELAHHLISRAGVEVAYDDVVRYFLDIFLGRNDDGLVARERWVAGPGLLERLSARFGLAIFTGRTLDELQVTLNRFAAHIRFNPLVTAEAVSAPKPSPEGLLRIAAENPGRKLWYVGDAVDDARSAKAAGVPFIGIAAPENPRRRELEGLFQAESAIAVLEDINQLESVLPS